jgi:hypothetical protein
MRVAAYPTEGLALTFSYEAILDSAKARRPVNIHRRRYQAVRKINGMR